MDLLFICKLNLSLQKAKTVILVPWNESIKKQWHNLSSFNTKNQKVNRSIANTEFNLELTA